MNVITCIHLFAVVVKVQNKYINLFLISLYMVLFCCRNCFIWVWLLILASAYFSCSLNYKCLFEQTGLLDRLGRSSLYWTSRHGWQGQDGDHLYKVRVAQWTHHRLHQWQALLGRCPSKLHWVSTQRRIKQLNNCSCWVLVVAFIDDLSTMLLPTDCRKPESGSLE